LTLCGKWGGYFYRDTGVKGTEKKIATTKKRREGKKRKRSNQANFIHARRFAGKENRREDINTEHQHWILKGENRLSDRVGGGQ